MAPRFDDIEGEEYDVAVAPRFDDIEGEESAPPPRPQWTKSVSTGNTTPAWMAEQGLPSEKAERERPKTGYVAALGRGLSDVVTLGHSDEILGAAETPYRMLTEGKSAGDAFRSGRDEYRQLKRHAENDQPGAWFTSQGLGGLGGAGLLSKAKTLKGALGISALESGGYGLGSSEADLTKGEFGDAAIDTGVSALIGPAATLLGAGVAKSFGWLYKAVKDGIVKPSEAAKYLRSKGVDLTVGQMQPNSLMAQMEESGTSVAGFGSTITAQREAAKRQWQDAVVDQTRPPNMSEVPTGDIGNRIDSVGNAFGEAYDSLKGQRVYPETHLGDGKWRPLTKDQDVFGAAAREGSFDLATKNRQIIATRDTRSNIGDFLENQLSILPGSSKDGKVPAEHLQAMRTNIRREIRKRMQGNSSTEDQAAAEMLSAADDAITELLDKGLPADVSSLVRAADAKYGEYKTMLDAVRRSGDKPGNFNPHHLSAAIKSKEEAASYARGAGGELRDLARHGADALNMRSPPTGARMITQAVSGVPILNLAPAGISAAANLPGPKRFLLGEAPIQETFRSFAKKAAPVMQSTDWRRLASRAADLPKISAVDRFVGARNPSPAFAEDGEGGDGNGSMAAIPPSVLKFSREVPALVSSKPGFFGKYDNFIRDQFDRYGEDGALAAFMGAAANDPEWAKSLEGP